MVEPVTKVMRTTVATCHPNATVLDACRILQEHATSTVVVIDEKIQGVFSERDLVNRVVCGGKDPATTLVKDVMTHPVVTVDSDSTDVAVASLIIDKHVKKIPVVQGDKLVGVVAESDLLKHLAESFFNG